MKKRSIIYLHICLFNNHLPLRMGDVPEQHCIIKLSVTVMLTAWNSAWEVLSECLWIPCAYGNRWREGWEGKVKVFRDWALLTVDMLIFSVHSSSEVLRHL